MKMYLLFNHSYMIILIMVYIQNMVNNMIIIFDYHKIIYVFDILIVIYILIILRDFLMYLYFDSFFIIIRYLINH